MQSDLHVLIGTTVIGFFIIFWLVMFTKQDIKFLNKDIERLQKTCYSIERDLTVLKYKNSSKRD